ncbi:MAG: 16S rRNA (adenine(1518)-N(6)/adenine(1519)-N(6))-dimethyltransferase RsmA [Treponema sp.]|jgi:16S rRNA (adenine1518-N6/adenine1519-N6)-dimethyltransferase|nr:16S rRNA (adenine(1518)-N(6)/adenine(1519)-N(6))-dimethyltransferase RsmA [Treponema sp.]
MNYNSAAELRAFLEKNGLGMRKKYGQNFLINPGARQTLANALDAGAGEAVWEIGPGLGAMTSLLLERGLPVRAFEIDSGFARALRELFAGNANFTLIEGDVLKTWHDHPPAPYLLGNLPYNIAATLLAGLIEQGRLFRRMVVTVQREVAQRMAAAPGSADYSSFSVLCASAYRVKPLMVIKSASFYPRPNVDSQGVLLELRDDAAPALPSVFYPLVRQLFSSRRKTVKNNLAGFIGTRQGLGQKPPVALAGEALERCAISGGRRAEECALEDFISLAKVIEDMGIS